MELSLSVKTSKRAVTSRHIERILKSLETASLPECAHSADTVLRIDCDPQEESLLLTVAVFEVYSRVPYHYKRHPYDQYVNVAADWNNANALWVFKSTQGYEAFVEYMDEYRDHFILEGKRPLQSIKYDIPYLD